MVSEIGGVRRFPDAEKLCSQRRPCAHGEAKRRRHPPWRDNPGRVQVAPVGVIPGGACSHPQRDEPDTVLQASGGEEAPAGGRDGDGPEDAGRWSTGCCVTTSRITRARVWWILWLAVGGFALEMMWPDLNPCGLSVLMRLGLRQAERQYAAARVDRG